MLFLKFRPKHPRRRKTDGWTQVVGWFCHTFLLIAATFWLTVFASVGIAEITHGICQKNNSQSKVCRAAAEGVISE